MFENQGNSNANVDYNQNIKNDTKIRGNCYANLDKIEISNLSEIDDKNSFYTIMKCCDPFNNLVLIQCANFHELCFKCLKNYYILKYSYEGKELKEILFDNKICPICKVYSTVEESLVTLKEVFGVEEINKFYNL